MSEKIYLKIDQQRCVKKPRVTIGDAMTVYCSDKDMIEKIGHIILVEFTLGKYDRKVLDALDVVGIIQKEYPDADIDCLGECDFVVEYKKPEKEGTVHWIKVAVICFITMVGSGYGIIAYNNDVSTTDIFDRVYELLGAEVFLYFDVAGTQVTARVGSGTELRSGDKASFTFDMNKIHIFDKETELTISN